jgi:antitoxin component of RelBE/YafQ-DinJ toxin-antitoxin module
MDQKERKARYDMEYARKNIRRKEIPFNLTQPEDAELFRYLESQENFTQYIKNLIREDMERCKSL